MCCVCACVWMLIKACHVRGGCHENLLWSMVVNLMLTMPQKWSRHQPGARKRKGRPMEKRLLKLQGVMDARPFVDKAKPRVNFSHLNTVTFTDTRNPCGSESSSGRASQSITTPQEGGLAMEEELRAGRGREVAVVDVAVGAVLAVDRPCHQVSRRRRRRECWTGTGTVTSKRYHVFQAKMLHFFRFLDKKAAFYIIFFGQKGCILHVDGTKTKFFESGYFFDKKCLLFSTKVLIFEFLAGIPRAVGPGAEQAKGRTGWTGQGVERTLHTVLAETGGKVGRVRRG
jgi:hypothetical protein